MHYRQNLHVNLTRLGLDRNRGRFMCPHPLGTPKGTESCFQGVSSNLLSWNEFTMPWHEKLQVKGADMHPLFWDGYDHYLGRVHRVLRKMLSSNDMGELHFQIPKLYCFMVRNSCLKCAWNLHSVYFCSSYRSEWGFCLVLWSWLRT